MSIEEEYYNSTAIITYTDINGDICKGMMISAVPLNNGTTNVILQREDGTIIEITNDKIIKCLVKRSKNVK